MRTLKQILYANIKNERTEVEKAVFAAYQAGLEKGTGSVMQAMNEEKEKALKVITHHRYRSLAIWAVEKTTNLPYKANEKDAAETLALEFNL